MRAKFLTTTMLAAILFVGCDSAKKNTDEKKAESKDEKKEVETKVKTTTPPFSVSITEDASMTGLPAMQSFVLATSGDNWLMFGGRTNGMHDFGGDNYEQKSFPMQDFNDKIYVYNTSTHTLTSAKVDVINDNVARMFKSTNMQHLQIGNDLYITGGYGENPLAKKGELERYTTYNYLAKIDVDAMISAVGDTDPSKSILASISYTQHEAVQATGGELFKMGDYFYLAGGHIYKGLFSIKRDSSVTKTNQVYLDAVHKFKVTETNGKLSISDVSKITDGFADDTTQFRRRDLPVVPGIQNINGALAQSITMYAGVFTSTNNTIPSVKSTSNWIYPIYINQAAGSDEKYFAIDDTYKQNDNVYSCANFVAYDPTSKMLYTTLIGGIGDASGLGFTNQVLTISRPISGITGISTQTIMSPIGTTEIYGAESEMIYSDAAKVVGLDGIFDISGLNSGDEMQIGQFYGGIQALTANPGGFGKGKSFASNKVFSITIKKN